MSLAEDLSDELHRCRLQLAELGADYDALRAEYHALQNFVIARHGLVELARFLTPDEFAAA